jgi:hypothetical protein|tara:strand:+ start:192 stop:557 length:366 start_codon:yes stop_codon:yes gene_type:complete
MTITTKKEDKKEDKKPTTLQDYKDQGWEVGPLVGMSNPPTYTLTKDGKTIKFREKMNMKKLMPKKLPERLMPKKDIDATKLGKDAAKKIKEFLDKKNAKGGIVKRYKGGLMVKPKAAKRGY